MNVGHGGTMMTVEHNKHMVVIDNRGSDNNHGRGQWTQELVMTSDVDWINIWPCIYLPVPVPCDSVTFPIP